MAEEQIDQAGLVVVCVMGDGRREIFEDKGADLAAVGGEGRGREEEEGKEERKRFDLEV